RALWADANSRSPAFVTILLPLAVPGLVATSIFAFIQAWNEFIFAYILLSSSDKQTLTIWLSNFLGTSRGTDWGGLMAGATLVAIPVVIFFVIVHRRIAFGLTAGAVRGGAARDDPLPAARYPAFPRDRAPPRGCPGPRAAAAAAGSACSPTTSASGSVS